MNSLYLYETRIGKVVIGDNGKAIILLKFAREDRNDSDRTDGNGTDTAGGCISENAETLLQHTAGSPYARSGKVAFTIGETPLIKEAAKQLGEYLEGKRKVFDIPIQLEGTPFQKAVWQALLGIPYGETRTYGEIARHIGNPKAARAVGMANNRNPVAVFVPCHRVIGADGRLVGYASGLDMKKRLLDLERKHSLRQAQDK
ncbi:MAG TPA: methylated-DNA--[protein]-cysteine S-methyltransferase [Clostridiales bacterium]|nr:methylated-DNA--[protein]-cysteine S-methyltransferase [Clostridiales bacterium]